MLKYGRQQHHLCPAAPADCEPNPDASADSFARGTVRGVAIAIATFSCFIHSFSRRAGILLSNLLALIKVGILLLIIFTTIAVAAGGLHKASDGTDVPSVFRNNTAVAFADASNDSNGYVQAFLTIGQLPCALRKQPSIC